MRMKCKFCFAELEEDVTVCPLCGKDLTEAEDAAEVLSEENIEETDEILCEEAEETAEVLCDESEKTDLVVDEEPSEETAAPKKKKAKVWQIILAVLGVVVLAVALAWAIIYSMGLSKTVLRTLGIGVKNDIYCKESYIAENDKLEKKVDTVVATVGEQELTLGELQAYYWSCVFYYMERNAYYLNMMGVDLYQPLDKLVYDEKTGMTYQQMFLENALESWHRYASLIELSKENGFVPNAEQQNYLDTLPSNIESDAKAEGYTDVEAFVDEMFFPGSSFASYLQFEKTSYLAQSYYDSLYESLIPTQEQMEAYYTAHEADFKANNFSKENGNYYNVRHVLIPVEGGTTNADGTVTYTDEEWEKCRSTAQALLDAFLKDGGKEEDFAQLAIDLSQDPGSAKDGGLYALLTKDYGFIKDFENWYLEEGRKPGDTGLVKNTESSTQGYHIMYFCESFPIWSYEAKAMMIDEGTNNLLEEAKAKFPMAVKFKKIMLGHMDLFA